MQIGDNDGLNGKVVLDIGANDGFFTLCALKSGAREVTSIDKDWSTWPQNIKYASEVWGVNPEIVTADFRVWKPSKRYDVILFLGVLYHLQDVFTAIEILSNFLVSSGGTIYIETQMTQVESALPIFEYASDIYPTIARQDKANMRHSGISNYLFPNMHALRNLADSYDFDFQCLDGPANLYSKENPTRQLFKFSR
ncbi:MAG TPA: class I SAM-dependent methyltransferase [Terriglobia bacterium]|nr:class I SAM-dependent methyltransferase [Terriglobia bacterium]